MIAKYLLPCENVYDESARIADRICGVVSAGARYRDIVVVICDYDDTVAIYNQVFSQAHIPTNVDVGMKLIDHALAKYLRDHILNSPWKAREVPPADDLVREKLTQILENIKATLGNQRLSSCEFCNMFCTLCSAMKISDVPHFADRVLLVSAKEYEPSFVPYLFVAGASDGAFPSATADTDIITEQDIDAMSIRIEPSATQQNRRARVHARNILASAVRELCVSYSAVNIKGERVSPSTLINEQFAQVASSKEQVASSKQVDSPFLKGGQGGFPPCELEKITVTQIENFVKCPYYYFLVNRLGLKKREFRTVTPQVIGTILHRFAEEFIKNKTPIEQILKEYTLPTYATQAVKKHAKQIAKFLLADIENSEFKPKLFEHKLATTIDGIEVSGRADRIDVANIDGVQHAVVVDYKSGAVTGPRLQLPIYMGFLRDAENRASTGPAPTTGYYLNLKTFKKTKVSPDEIDPAMQATHTAIQDIKNGVIAPKPLGKAVCEYCPAGASCLVRGVT